MKEIFIYGIIGACDDEPDCVSAQSIIDQISWTDDGELKIRINSPGGSIFEGIAIFDALNKCGKRVTVQIDGIAASMASIIAMVGEEIVMSPFAQMMTHKPCGSVEGSALEIRQKADLLDELEKTMLSIYVARTGLSEAECKAKFLSDTNSWFNAQEAVAAGLADRIEEGRLKTIAIVPGTESLVSVYKHFAAKLNTNMDFIEQLRKNLNLSAELTEDSIFAHLSDLQARASQVDGLTQQVTDLQAKVSDFEAAEVAARDLEVSNLIDTAIAERRILPTAKADWTAMFKASHEAAAASLKAIAAVPDLSKIPGGKGGDADERKDWSFSDWSKKDAKGLETMKLERKDDFVALFKAEYGVEPK
jgi:ATP-dependent Clp endopeptidase proteolytic subunit ClpP